MKLSLFQLVKKIGFKKMFLLIKEHGVKKFIKEKTQKGIKINKSLCWNDSSGLDVPVGFSVWFFNNQIVLPFNKEEVTPVFKEFVIKYDKPWKKFSSKQARELQRTLAKKI